MFDRAHAKWTLPQFNVLSERRGITFRLSDTQDPHPHWSKDRDPEGPPLGFKALTFAMVDALIAAEPWTPIYRPPHFI